MEIKTETREVRGIEFNPRIKYCKKCIVPNTRPDSNFDSEGVCQTCRNQESKKSVDWAQRERDFAAIMDKYRGCKGNGYDCMIPVSGGKDSTYQIHLLTIKYKMHPLCVTWAQCQITPVGLKNRANMVKLGVDHVLFTPREDVVRKMTRRVFIGMGKVCWPCDTGLHSWPLRFAINFDIPLLFWGENPSWEYLGAKENKEERDEEFRRTVDLGSGLKPEDQIKDPELAARKKPGEGLMAEGMLGVDGITASDLYPYLHVPDEELRAANIRPIFMGYYFDWDHEKQVQFVKEHCGWCSRSDLGELRSQGAYRDYDSIMGKFWDISDYLMYIKFGYNRATNHLSMAIRRGTMTREEAARIVQRLQTVFPDRYLPDFLKFIDMTEDEFWKVVDSWRNKEVWKKVGNMWVNIMPPIA